MTYTIHNNGNLGGLLLYWHYGGLIITHRETYEPTSVDAPP